MASALEEVIQCLEEEVRALNRSPRVLSQSPENIKKCLEIVAAEGLISANGPKKRSQDVLRVVKGYSPELFVLCALATNQKILGKVKWTRTEIMALCKWWDEIEKPMDILQEYWKDISHGI